MVFKRVLKGIGRLMLTTAVMCGVGLFLCSSEVKAAVPSTLNGDGEVYINVAGDNYEIVIDAHGNTTYSTIKNPEIRLNSKPVVDSSKFTIPADTVTNSESDAKILTLAVVSKSAVDSALMEEISKNTLIENTDFRTESSVELKAEITVDSTKKTSKDYIESKPIYKVSAGRPEGVYDEVVFRPDYEYTVNGRNSQYGYKDESYTINHKNVDAATLDNYYMLVKNDDLPTFNVNDDSWKSGKIEIGTGIIGTKNVSYKVAYLPKVDKFSVLRSSNSKSTLSATETGQKLSIVTNTKDVNTTLTFGIESFKSTTESQNEAILGYYNKNVNASPTTNMNLVDPANLGTKTCDIKMQLSSLSTTGVCKAIIGLELGTNTKTKVAEIELPITVSAVQATDFKLKNDSISVMAGSIKEVELIEGFLPANASQSLSDYVITVVEETASSLKTDGLTVDSNGIIKIAPKESVTSGTTKLKVTVKDTASSTTFDSKYITVNIVSFDKDKTISSIKNSNKNYITYNKDKGYSLDIKQLIIDNAKDTSGNAVTITKDQIKDVYVGDSSCSDGIWKPSEAALNKKVTCKINGTAISSDSFTVSAYPMPTATYSSSNRTLSVKIPTKVATSYSDDNNIRQSKGFKLILEDSSGNTLYEYTDSKYQSVLSSSSESTVTYTVPAADIEGMVTSAASNGKFSADTTSVKFKVIPMGYKQSSTSDETIKAKDEIAGKTDAVTVYKVSASGTNFTSSAAYGLDGQTVSITATPNSGYSFKQWSDGNTSNPRQVKVSASGTRSFQAVAGDRVTNTVGGTDGGTDNSELYDDVPKTAESNSAIWLIVFMVFAVMGTTYALYLQLRAANSKHDR